jgi:hypothetical protein
MKKNDEKIAEVGLNELFGIAMTFVVVTIGLAIGIDVVSDFQADYTANSLEYNASGDGLTGLSTLSGKLPTIAVVIGAALLIGILIRNLSNR